MNRYYFNAALLPEKYSLVIHCLRQDGFAAHVEAEDHHECLITNATRMQVLSSCLNAGVVLVGEVLDK